MRGKMRKGIVAALIISAVTFGGYVGIDNLNKTEPNKNEIVQVVDTVQVNVDRVIDGDTFEIMYEGKETKVRLIGVDTPETVNPKKPIQFYGKESSDFSKSSLSGKNVKIEFDKSKYDMYGRLLAYVYIDNKMYNKTLLELGYAKTSFYEPNTKYKESFIVAEKKSRESKLGIWNNTERELWESKNTR